MAKILQALDESGKADDTIVIFTSDHGELMGDHGILGKTLMYEESIKVPLLLRAPHARRRAAADRRSVQPHRLGAHAARLAGAGSAGPFAGAEPGAGAVRRDDLAANDVFVEWSGADGHPPASIGEAEPNRSLVHPLRTIVAADGWKLNLYGKGQGELYDLNADPTSWRIYTTGPSSERGLAN